MGDTSWKSRRRIALEPNRVYYYELKNFVFPKEMFFEFVVRRSVIHLPQTDIRFLRRYFRRLSLIVSSVNVSQLPYLLSTLLRKSANDLRRSQNVTTSLSNFINYFQTLPILSSSSYFKPDSCYGKKKKRLTIVLYSNFFDILYRNFYFDFRCSVHIQWRRANTLLWPSRRKVKISRF